MTASDKIPLQISRHFDEPPERVFDAWLAPEQAGRFLFTTDDGRIVKVEIDARVDGRFVFVDRRDGEDIEHVGRYVEIERPRRLVFRFSVPRYSPDSDLITISFEPEGPGCLLTLHCASAPAYRERTQQGWQLLLNKLAGVLA